MIVHSEETRVLGFAYTRQSLHVPLSEIRLTPVTKTVNPASLFHIAAYDTVTNGSIYGRHEFREKPASNIPLVIVADTFYDRLDTVIAPRINSVVPPGYVATGKVTMLYIHDQVEITDSLPAGYVEARLKAKTYLPKVDNSWQTGYYIHVIAPRFETQPISHQFLSYSAAIGLFDGAAGPGHAPFAIQPSFGYDPGVRGYRIKSSVSFNGAGITFGSDV